MKSQARVVVIGGGMFGVSLLYHLTKEGWSDVVLCEKGELTSGSTWHAAAQCPNFVGSYNYAKVHQASIDLYTGLEAETGLSTGWHGCGGIRLAVTPQEVDWFHHVKGIARNIGFHMEIIPPEEIARHHPLLQTDGVLAAAYTANDGHLDPSGAVQSMARGARNGGAEIYRQNRVTGIERLTGGEFRVVTENGAITCEHVVNAAGCYGPQVGEMVGIKTPYVNIMHCYVVTENHPAIEALDTELPVVRDPYSSNYLRQEGNGILIGAYETADAQTIWDEGVDWDLDMPLFDPDFDRISLNLERGAERLPAFAEVGIKRIVCGAITHTPDSSFLGGPAAGVRNFWQFCGTSIGISQGGGAGRFLAQWMVHGQSELNPREFDPRRYGDWAMDGYARAKAVEDYEMMYAPGLPGEERMAGRPVRMTPICPTLKSRGAVFTEVFGWERPKYFDPSGAVEQPGWRRTNAHDLVNAEVLAVRERVGIIDLTTFSKYEISGADAEACLNRLCARRMPTRDGGIALTHMLTDAGRIESEITVTRLGDMFYVLSSIVAQLHDYDWLSQHLGADEDVTICDITDETGMLLLTGPRARDVLAGLTDADLSNAAFPWLSGKAITVGGVACRALRVSYAGELGWELHHPIGDMQRLYDALWQAGTAHGMVNFGSYALNALRLEKGYKGWGAELTTEISPVEANIGRFVNMKKGDFKGRAGVEAHMANPLGIRCVYLSVDVNDADCRGNEPVMVDDRAVGVVTSGAWCATVGTCLAFAYVEDAFATPGTALQVEVLGDRRGAIVLDDAPQWDPENARLRA